MINGKTNKKISLTDLGNLAEAFAAIGVIISVIYLSVQIRQNTRAIRASSYKGVADGISEFQISLAENKDLALIYQKGIDDVKQLTPVELTRFEMIIGQLFVKYDVAVYFYHHNLIDSSAIGPYNKYILFILKKPGVAVWWEEAKYFYSENMRNYIIALKNG